MLEMSLGSASPSWRNLLNKLMAVMCDTTGWALAGTVRIFTGTFKSRGVEWSVSERIVIQPDKGTIEQLDMIKYNHSAWQDYWASPCSLKDEFPRTRHR